MGFLDNLLEKLGRSEPKTPSVACTYIIRLIEKPNHPYYEGKTQIIRVNSVTDDCQKELKRLKKEYSKKFPYHQVEVELYEQMPI